MIFHSTAFRQCISVKYLAMESSCERSPDALKRREEK
jgi:hypothetical protein